MLKKTIKYTDYKGIEREEDFFFNLTKAELLEMDLSATGGMVEVIDKITKTKDTASLIKIFKDLLLKSYGEKSLDGRRFMKQDDHGRPLYVAFSETEAYTKLFMELATNDQAASEFINGVLPADLKERTNQA